MTARKMTAAAVIRHCASRRGATAERPFGPEVLVFKVAGKVFALVGDTFSPPTVSLQCDPELAIALRAAYPAVTAGYHLNKRHWNSVVLDGSVPDDELRSMIDDSYDLVVAGLPKRLQRTVTEG